MLRYMVGGSGEILFVNQSNFFLKKRRNVLTQYFEGLMELMCVAGEIRRTAMSKQRKKMKIEICQFDGTGRNISIFHTKKGVGS